MTHAVSPTSTLRILLVEDSSADANLVRMALTSSLGSLFELTHTTRLEHALQALGSNPFSVVLLDLGLPDSQGLASFSVLHAKFRDVPVVILTGTRDDATALGAMRLGAQDFLVKGKYDEDALIRVIRHAIERQRLLQQLEKSLAYVRKLLHDAEGGVRLDGGESVLAICAWCKKIRDGSGRWQSIEEFLDPRSDATITHGGCPACMEQVRGGGHGDGAT